MKLTRLKLTGFKSFVEPTEFHIEPGLSGVVGPNGCGKSNLVEALRWVMGESSYKNMRASGMEDVIFAGSGDRPARNMAEVALTLDNSDRKAPAQFNDHDLLEVTRRIERDAGSTYRVNGREVRARDVQLMFADAATGARSPALVRQGQISEIISAKPQSRRRILEDAAGIGGLHSRRHEAELRLKAADDNLLRLDDVLREIEAQGESLRRQSRQAERYRALAAEIRRAEALLAATLLGDAEAAAQAAERELEAIVRELAAATLAQGEAARAQAVAAHELPRHREAEAAAAAALTRLRRGLDEVEAENKRARQRAEELARRQQELDADIARERATGADATQSLAWLEAEAEQIRGTADEDIGRMQAAEAARLAADAELAAAEAAFAEAQQLLADWTARRSALERALAEARARQARHISERDRLARDLAALEARSGSEPDLAALRAEAEAATQRAAAAETAVAAARASLAGAREEEQAARGPLAEADRTAQRLETEVRTLQKLLAPPAGARWPAMLERVAVAKGYERALGAALGEDLDASVDISAPAHWRDSGDGAGDPALPQGARPLAELVKAPPSLQRRLKQIGLVERADGARLATELAPGQRLVSAEGDLWRWDGFTTASEAPSAAARRLAEKNRLGDLERGAQSAREAVEALRDRAESLQAATKALAGQEQAADEALRQARRGLDQTRETLTRAERAQADSAARRAALSDALARSEAAAAEEARATAAAEAALAAQGSSAELDAALAGRRAALAEARASATEARTTLDGLTRDRAAREARLEAIATETGRWRERARRAEAAMAEIEARRRACAEEAEELAAAPDTYLVRRRELVARIEEATATRQAAADTLAVAERTQAEADKAASQALAALSAVRERRAGLEARREAAIERVADVRRAAAELLEGQSGDLRQAAGLKPGDTLPLPAETERKLAHLKGERERLGAVNLRAESELSEVEAKREALVREKEELSEAIRRLRQAIGALNREGRERLLAAFDVVNGHFKQLFEVLFGGGEAELTLVDAEDPLEAGLEILARPPGKKPQTMTLLSGGEQALTAIALIFAVFLTNPAPICVLDEVDAPLDDANVERYCDLLRAMVGRTATRFIVITHNPITMARMDRLFGVTMAERGVSQLVSVDLETAERIREAV